MIESFRVQNFKSIRDATIDFDPAVTVLVGRNSSGKTNLIDSLRFLRDYLRGPEQASDRNQREFREFVPAQRTGAKLQYDVTLKLPQFPYPLCYALVLQMQPQRSPGVIVVKEGLSGGSEKNAVFLAEKDSATSDRKGLKIPPPGQVSRIAPQGQLALLGQLPVSREASAVYGVLTESLGLYDFPLGLLKPNHDDEKRGVGRREANQRGLEDDGFGHLDVFGGFTRDHRLMARKDWIAALLHTLNPAVESVEVDQPRRASKIVLGHRIGGQLLPFDLSQESEGFRRVFAHLLALYQDPAKLLNCFEEPENGVHPGAMELLAEQFKLAAEEDRGQVLLTTHSPRLLSHLPPSGLRVVEMIDGETKVGPLEAGQLEALRDNLLAPGELLDVDEARRATDTNGAAGG